jgi:hypothetical protein
MCRVLWLAAAAAIFILPAGSWCQQQADHPQEQQAGQAQQAQPATTQPQDSLAAAARKAREQKKETPKAPKVFTNDDIPTQGGISTVGQPAAPAAETASSAAAAPKANDEKQWRDKFAQLRHKLERDQADLDVMERELGDLNVQYYADPYNQMMQELTRSDINKKTNNIEAKKKEVEADKQALADAEDDLRKAGGDPGWAR